MTDTENAKIETVDFSSALGERYLAYALSTIMSRSLPDVRDGLKPVHRRLLYAMLQLKLNPDSGYKKCARVVGDVIGKYHPHGDVAVYDTLVRLAQNFSLRYPLIDGQGNFGSIDGDNAAAMRYTESRMTPIALALMGDIDKETVPFRLTYDDSELEPSLMPASFPNLLANGSEGIAVGMATSIPPHNLHELCDALMHMIDHPDAKTQDLLKFVKGPDFPTGGVIIDSESVIAQCYETGRGSIRVRAKWEKEQLSHGLYQIIITEIPYQVQKSKLIEHVADLFRDKKLPMLGNIRDESAEEMRIVLEPKTRTCPADALMESLFKQTALESRISVNMNVLSSRSIPVVMNLQEILAEFLEHRNQVVLKRSQFLLGKINHRLEILAGLKIAYLNLDEIIKIIREEDEPKPIMMQRFGLTDIQTEAILNMRLRSLRKLEEQEILVELTKLEKEKAELEQILSSDKTRWSLIKKEIKSIQKQFGFGTALGERRTMLIEASSASQVIDITAFIEREPITIICSKMGWIRSSKGHITDFSSIKYKDGDEERFWLHTYTTDKVLIFTESGRFYTLLADNISKTKGYGESVRLMVDMANEDDIVNISVFTSGVRLLVAASNGKGFIVLSDDVIAQTKLGRQVLVAPNGHKAICCLPAIGDKVATTGENRKLLIFDIQDIPEMKKGQGVIFQRFKDAKMTWVKILNAADGLSWQQGGRVRLETNLTPWTGGRGSSGKIPPMGFPKDGKF
ncbi:MAG: DNA topoisomerase IV subunit A [Pseudomonadota bacterium]